MENSLSVYIKGEEQGQKGGQKRVYCYSFAPMSLVLFTVTVTVLVERNKATEPEMKRRRDIVH